MIVQNMRLRSNDFFCGYIGASKKQSKKIRIVNLAPHSSIILAIISTQ